MREKKRIDYLAGEAGTAVCRGTRAVSGAGEGFYAGAGVDVADSHYLNAARAEGVDADGGEQVL